MSSLHAHINVILWSMTAMACFGVAVCFTRFWRQTTDRLFGLFALAFALLGVNILLLAAINPAHESRHLIYLLRLAAFLVIIAAIVDKNRTRQ
jgi:uncharacterized protein DUF5985